MPTVRQLILEHYDAAVRDLVGAHAMLARSPLVLAVWYRRRDTKNVHLLEVIENFPGQPTDQPLTTQFGPSERFRIMGDLYLTLANPEQLRNTIDLAATRGRLPHVVAAKKLIDDVTRDGDVVYVARSPAGRARLARKLKQELGLS
jgi:hypothetical protein